MSLRVTIFLADNTTLGSGTPMQLLSRGRLLSSAPMDAEGVVTFDVDPASSQGLSVRVDTQAQPPAKA